MAFITDTQRERARQRLVNEGGLYVRGVRERERHVLTATKDYLYRGKVGVVELARKIYDDSMYRLEDR